MLNGEAEAVLAPEALELVADAKRGRSPAVRDYGRQVYGFPLLTAEGAALLLDELVAFHRSGRVTARANSNNRFSMLVSELGFTPLLTKLVAGVAPLVRRLGRGDPRFRHAHTVQRVAAGAGSAPLPGSNRGSRHTDGSRVTLNVNLAGDWTGGGDLFFFGGEPLRVPQQVGHAVLHTGLLEHQAELLQAGYRINLVIWCD